MKMIFLIHSDNKIKMKTTVAVFFGGRSTEHEISVISALQTINAIDSNRYHVVPVFINKEGKWLSGSMLKDIKVYRHQEILNKECDEVYMRSEYGDRNLYYAKPKGFFSKKQVLAKIDVVFPVLHGSNGEDGVFQGVMENIGVPYVGCNVLSSAVGMDKIFMKMILQNSGIPVVPFIWFTDKEWFVSPDKCILKINDNLHYPVIVKPANLGSSVGIGTAKNEDELKKVMTDACRFSSRIIVEKMITDMQEINCSVLGDADECQASVLEEPIKTGELLSYEDKYMGGSKSDKGMASSSKRIPAQLSVEVTDKIKNFAQETFQVLDCNGVSRIDVMIDKSTGEIFVNEINTIPGSLSYYLWEFTGMDFNELTNRLISLALKRNRELSSKTTNYSLNIFSGGSGLGTKGIKGGVKNS